MLEPTGRALDVLNAAIHAVEDRAPGPPFATDDDVWRHVKDRGFDRAEVRELLHVLGADWLDIKPLEDDGPIEVQGIENRP